MGGPGGAHGCGSLEEYDQDPPRPPNILSESVAALHDAGLQANLDTTIGADRCKTPR